jgi:septal ring-binding cell division protein DamX
VSLVSRLAKLEFALVPAGLGYRHFVTVDGGLTYLENTPAPRANSLTAGPLDYRAALVGAGGTLPEGAATIGPAELSAIGASGWDCIVISYGTWSEPPAQQDSAAAAEVAEAEAAPVMTIEPPELVEVAPRPAAPASVPASSSYEIARQEMAERLLAEALNNF